MKKGSNGEDGYSGFFMRDHDTGETDETELAGLLRTHDVTDLVVCGLATDYCVNATALDGMKEGFKVRVLWNAIRAVNLKEGDGERAIAATTACGVGSYSTSVMGRSPDSRRSIDSKSPGRTSIRRVMVRGPSEPGMIAWIV